MKFHISLITLLLALNIQAQNSYFGKKNYVSVSGSLNFAIINSLVNNPQYAYDEASDLLIEKKQWVRYNYGIAIGRALSDKVGIAVELSHQNLKIQRNSSYSYHFANTGETYSDVKFERYNTSIFSIAPRLELYSSKKLFPVGLVHQFGVGINMASLILKDDYKVGYYYDDGFVSSDYQIADAKGILKVTDPLKATYINFFYGLNLRYPVSKFLILNFGFRYVMNLPKLFNDFYEPSNPYNKEEFKLNVRYATRLNFVHMNIGLVVPF